MARMRARYPVALDTSGCLRGRATLFAVAGGEVGGPVLLGAVAPGDGGVDVGGEQGCQDWGWEGGGEGDEGGVAPAAGGDASGGELVGHVRGMDRQDAEVAGEQPAGQLRGVEVDGGCRVDAGGYQQALLGVES